MAKKDLPLCRVVVNPNPKGHATRHRTVTSSQGGDYRVALPPGQPVLLVGEDEIAAFAEDLKNGTLGTLTPTAKPNPRTNGCGRGSLNLRSRSATPTQS